MKSTRRASGSATIPPPRKPTTAIENLERSFDSDVESIVDSDESDDDASDGISALNNDSLYSADIYAGSHGTAKAGSGRSGKSNATTNHIQSSRSNSSRNARPQIEIQEQELRRSLTTIEEESEKGSEDGARSEDSYDAESSDSSSDNEHYDSSDSDSGSESDSDSDSDSNSDYSESDSSVEDIEASERPTGDPIVAEPMDVLNAIACSLWLPEQNDEISVRSGQSVSSDEDGEEEVLDGEAAADLGTLSRQERDRAGTVFHHCATGDGKHLNEVQFGVALALLGQTEKKEELKLLFDDLAISDGLAVDGFFTALNRLRRKDNEDDALLRIQDAFDALYEGTCFNDDQKDFTGQRYIYAADFRLLLTTTGEETERLTDEEANELLRDCKPIYPRVINSSTGAEEDDGIEMSVLRGRIFFEQYRAMLLDICP